MKNILLYGIAAVVVVLSSCSAYKASRTPDDVYYSPAKPAIDREDEDRYESYANSSPDDHYLRMKVRNRYQWSGIDDFGYWNDSRYDFGYSCFPSRSVLLNPYYGVSVWNPYYMAPWGNWYNPVYTVVYYKTPRAFYGTNSKTNLTAYRNGSYYNPNSRQTFGGLLKSAFSNNNNNNSYNPSRSFNSTTTPGSSAGGRSGGFNSSGSTTPSARPPR